MKLEIREIDSSLVPQYRDLRLRGLQEHPEAFGESSNDFALRTLQDIQSKLENSKSKGGFIIGAFAGDQIVGTVALGRQDGAKSQHRAILWGMYVLPEFRNQQVGSQLLQHLIAKAKNLTELLQIHLAVTVSNVSAFKLYERFGFKTYGTDPRALKVDSIYFDEYLMVLGLRAE
jgi:ribosomal protein S18 acetylase RimI-like enzyme